MEIADAAIDVNRRGEIKDEECNKEKTGSSLCKKDHKYTPPWKAPYTFQMQRIQQQTYFNLGLNFRSNLGGAKLKLAGREERKVGNWRQQSFTVFFWDEDARIPCETSSQERPAGKGRSRLLCPQCRRPGPRSPLRFILLSDMLWYTFSCTGTNAALFFYMKQKMPTVPSPPPFSLLIILDECIFRNNFTFSFEVLFLKM